MSSFIFVIILQTEEAHKSASSLCRQDTEIQNTSHADPSIAVGSSPTPSSPIQTSMSKSPVWTRVKKSHAFAMRTPPDTSDSSSSSDTKSPAKKFTRRDILNSQKYPLDMAMFVLGEYRKRSEDLKACHAEKIKFVKERLLKLKNNKSVEDLPQYLMFAFDANSMDIDDSAMQQCLLGGQEVNTEQHVAVK